MKPVDLDALEALHEAACGRHADRADETRFHEAVDARFDALVKLARRWLEIEALDAAPYDHPAFLPALRAEYDRPTEGRAWSFETTAHDRALLGVYFLAAGHFGRKVLATHHVLDAWATRAPLLQQATAVVERLRRAEDALRAAARHDVFRAAHEGCCDAMADCVDLANALARAGDEPHPLAFRGGYATTGGPDARRLNDVDCRREGTRAAWAAQVGAECVRQGVEMPVRWVERSSGDAISAVWWGPEGLGGRYAHLEFDDDGDATMLLSDRSKAPKVGEPERYDWMTSCMVVGGGEEDGPAIGLVEAVRRIGAYRRGE